MTHDEARTAALAQGTLSLGEAPLSARHEAFARAKVEGLNNTEAAIKAGFSAKTAAQKGSHLNRQVHIRLRIELLQNAITEATVVKQAEGIVGVQITLADHLNELARLRDLAVADKEYNVAVAAETARGKAAGFHAERMRPEDLNHLDEQGLEDVASGRAPRHLKLG